MATPISDGRAEKHHREAPQPKPVQDANVPHSSVHKLVSGSPGGRGEGEPGNYVIPVMELNAFSTCIKN